MTSRIPRRQTPLKKLISIRCEGLQVRTPWSSSSSHLRTSPGLKSKSVAQQKVSFLRALVIWQSRWTRSNPSVRAVPTQTAKSASRMTLSNSNPRGLITLARSPNSQSKSLKPSKSPQVKAIRHRSHRVRPQSSSSRTRTATSRNDD